MPKDTDNAILITGCGWVTPFAAGTIRDCLAAAPSAPPAELGSEGYWSVPDATRDGFPDLSNELKRDKAGWITGAALETALTNARIDRTTLDPNTVGLVVGCALAGQLGMIAFASEVRDQSPRFVSPIHFPQTVGNYVAGALARAYGVCGPNVTIATGTASGLEALIQACDLLKSGQAEVIVAGGTETLTKEVADGFHEPGMVPSEGACLFVLERAATAAARGATPLATVTGFEAATADKELPAPAPGVLVSASGAARPGSIAIERCVGRCFAALGAAVVAAGIGAAAGLPVPHFAGRTDTEPELGPVTTTTGSSPGPLAVICAAPDDCGQRKTLRLEVAHDAAA